jgi:hypothetical protein
MREKEARCLIHFMQKILIPSRHVDPVDEILLPDPLHGHRDGRRRLAEAEQIAE